MGNPKSAPATKPELSMAVLYGEQVGSRLEGRAAIIIGFTGGEPILEVFRPVAQGKSTQERPKAYSADLADGCWSLPAFLHT